MAYGRTTSILPDPHADPIHARPANPSADPANRLAARCSLGPANSAKSFAPLTGTILAHTPAIMLGSAGPHDAHDRLFKYACAPAEAMGVLVRRMLPAELLDHLDSRSLRPAPTERTNARLGSRADDLHFTADYASLPMIVCLLFTQNPARNTPTRLSMILDVPPNVRELVRMPIELIAYVDDFSGSVLDDPFASPAVLARLELARAFLHAYKNPGSLTEARMAALAPLFDVLLDQDEPLASNDIDALLTYVVRVFEERSPVRAAIEAAIRNKRRVREMYITIADSWFNEGERKGRAEGRAEAVLGVLEHRNVFIPSPVRERVLSTRDEPELQRWFHRAFSVSEAHELFETTRS